jgi:Hypothetical protein (DUF2513)
MKRDMNLIRELLLTIESLPVGRSGVVAVSPAGKNIAIDGYDATHIKYHLSLLREAGFLDCAGRVLTDGTMAVRGLTWAGHDYVDAVRDPEIWKKTKRGAEAAGSWTFDLVKELAKGFIKTKIEEHTGVKL